MDGTGERCRCSECLKAEARKHLRAEVPSMVTAADIRMGVMGRDWRHMKVDFDKLVAVDFDETLSLGAVYPETGEPNLPLIGLLRALRDRGYKIILHTSRLNSHEYPTSSTRGVAEMMKVLIRWDVPIDYFWTGPGKPMAVLFLDDHALNAHTATEMGVDRVIRFIEATGSLNIGASGGNSGGGEGSEGPLTIDEDTF